MTRATTLDWWGTQLRRAWASREVRWLALIIVVATALRVVWIVYASRPPQELHDPLFYMLYGAQIADGNGYRLINGEPSAYYPIGYPAALGGVFALVKHTPIPDNLVFAATSFNVFASVATIPLVYFVARRLFNPAVGLVSAAWMAVFPNLIYHTGTYLTETLFMLLVMAALAVLFLPDWRERRLEPLVLAVFGVLLGLSALVRPISLMFIPLLAIAWLVAGFGWRRALGHGALVAVVTAATLTPWAIRNFAVMEAPIVLSANLGDNLCMGHYPLAPGHFALPDSCFAGYEHLKRPEYEVRRNNDNTERAIRFALRNPGYEVKLSARKVQYTYEHDHDGLWAVESYGHDVFMSSRIREPLERAGDIFFFFTISVAGLGAFGLIAPRIDARRVFVLLAGLWLAFVSVIFFGDARFHVPAAPFFAIAAAWMAVNARRLPSLAALVIASPGVPRETPARSGAVEVAEGEAAVAEHDALQDA